MKTSKTNKKRGGNEEELLDFLSFSLALTPEQRRVIESTEALQELSIEQMALVMSAFYGD